MLFIDKLNTPGEHPLLLEGVVGAIEAIITIPLQVNSHFVAIIGHPHSLQGGTMNNKVVTTLVRVFKELNIPSLRFNFRGVGQSVGKYDDGIGESQDMIAFAKKWEKEQPNIRFIFAGFSFGSFVAYRAASHFKESMLITIAPPVHHYNYQEFLPAPQPWLIVQGLEDEVVPAELVINFAQTANPVLPIIHFADTTHFFHGKLIELKIQLIDYLRAQVPTL